ncbi:MAG: hypothetical protein JJT99_14185 [Rhodobacteraceae bacterium]|nr:hypothetical protein [Paracoccaceae bacterium]
MCEIGATAGEDLRLFIECIGSWFSFTGGFPDWITAFASVAIACFAFVQWRTLKQHTKISLLDKRMSCFLAYEECLQHIRGAPSVDVGSELFERLLVADRMSPFLFGKHQAEKIRGLSTLVVRYNTELLGRKTRPSEKSLQRMREEVDRLYSARYSDFEYYLLF